MKAMIRNNYGNPSILKMREIEKPVPKDDEVLIRVQASSLNALDWRFLKADPFLIRFDSGLIRPKNKILGLDVAGTVEKLGSRVSKFHIGDEVYADIVDLRGGAFAEYLLVPERLLVKKPENLSLEEAACMPLVGVTAIQALKIQGKITKGQKVLIYGASGGLGTTIVQVAKALGTEITAFCSTKNIDVVKGLGADKVIDYTKTNIAELKEKFDLILGINGQLSLEVIQELLAPSGQYILVGGSVKAHLQAKIQGPKLSKKTNQTLGVLEDIHNRKELLEVVTDLVEKGKVKPVIDRKFNLEDLPTAMTYLGQGHAQGKILITVPKS
jgi:NADPH:quinone reductase-like Zn-dependent oxidoreductase